MIIEVDARYIKGMLTNPDIAPSASVNHWIASILSFHFTLVHVAGTHYSPDGLSHHPQQPKDAQVDNKEEFSDWVDQLHGFVHQINPVTTRPFPSHQHSTFTLSSDFSKGEEVTYNNVPRSNKAI